jgi:hypothetical protein
LLGPLGRAQVGKEMEMRNTVPDAAVGIAQDKDPTLLMQRFHEKWNDLMTALGDPLVETAISMMDGFSKALRDLSQSAHQDADGVRRLAEAIGILGITLGGAGMTLLLSALGPTGWLVLGLGAVAAAMAYFDPKSFDIFKNFFTSLPGEIASGVTFVVGELKNGISLLWQGIKQGFGTMFDTVTPDLLAYERQGARKILEGLYHIWNAELLGLPDMIAGAIHKAVAGIGQMISNAIASLGSMIHNPFSNPGNVPAQASPMKYVPPASNPPVHVTTEAKLYVGSRQFAQAVSHSVARHSTQVSSGANYDDRLHPVSVDQWAYKDG